jgi:hypothetical protein
MEKRFIVTDHNYLNTGGNCMVSIFAVYDTQENVSRWVIANEEGFSLQTADTISNCDFQMDCDEIMDKVLLGNWNWSALTTEPCWDQHLFEDDEWELYKYCQFEFYKKDCKYFNNKVRLAVNELPNDLYRKLSDEYVSWANDTGSGCLTDGYDVFMDDNYEPEYFEPEDYNPHDDLERQLQEIKNFRKWFNDLIGPKASEEDLQKLYDGYITIAVAGNSVKLPFDAENFTNIDHTLKRAIEEW